MDDFLPNPAPEPEAMIPNMLQLHTSWCEETNNYPTFLQERFVSSILESKKNNPRSIFSSFQNFVKSSGLGECGTETSRGESLCGFFRWLSWFSLDQGETSQHSRCPVPIERGVGETLKL